MARALALSVATVAGGIGLPDGNAATDTVKPQAMVASPAAYASLASGPATISGTATDDVRLRSVRVVITNQDTKTTSSSLGALGTPTSSASSWSFSADLPAGSYSVKVQARDWAGNISAFTTPRPFDVAKPAGSAFLTLMFGRTQWALTDSRCQPLPNTVALDEVAVALHNRGLVGTGGVVASQTADSALTCYHSAFYPSWSHLAQLRDDYRMSFVSAGTRYVDNTLLSPTERYQNICGSLASMFAHGHDRAWGTFAYPSSKYNATLQTQVTARCFAYGRVYTAGRSHDDVASRSPWLERANSITGGACNDPALPCFDIYVAGSGGAARYYNRDQLLRLMAVGPGEWSTIYMYKFITGSRNATGSGGARWDCTSADWRAHWTTVPETYCWGDFLAAIDAIPTGVTVTDPATVAQTWNSDAASPTTTLTSEPANGDSGTSVTFSFTADEVRAWFSCSLDGSPSELCDSGVAYADLPPGPHSFSVHATDAFGNVGEVLTYTWLAT